MQRCHAGSVEIGAGENPGCVTYRVLMAYAVEGVDVGYWVWVMWVGPWVWVTGCRSGCRSIWV
jgi:hypothetical protein